MVFDVVLLDKFSCKKDGEEIKFPFKKTAILFAYLVINKKAYRKDLAKLLWSNVDETEVRKNLRNALYTLRKVIDPDIIITEGNSKIYLNPKNTYNCDFTSLLNEDDCLTIIESYGDFLSDINLNKVDSYQKWVSEIQNKLLNKYINACDKLINEYQENNQLDNALKMLQQKVKYYCFDEESYREIMKIHFEKGEFDKAIEAYTTINTILSKNLNINCEKETFDLYEKIVNKKISMIKTCSNSYTGLHNDLILKKLTDAYENLIKYNKSSFIVLNGAEGSGKTFLINKFLTTSLKDVKLFKIHCYRNDKDYVFRSLETFIADLEYQFKTLSFNDLLTLAFKEANMDFKQNVPYFYFDKYFINMIEKVLSNNKLILIVEDIHYMDISSLTLFNKLISAKLSNLIIIFTKIDEKTSLDLSDVVMYDVITWTKEETQTYMKKRLNYKTSDEDINMIMKESNGNPFHIKNLVNLKNISKINIDEIFGTIYNELSIEEKGIVNILASFIRAISLNNLSKIVAMSNISLIESLRILEEKEIIISHRFSLGINYQIANESFKDYVYNNLDKYVKRQLHTTIANNFENFVFEKQTTVYLYQSLIDHYNAAFNKTKALEYRIKYNSIKNYFACELFSIMSMSLTDSLYLDHDADFEQILKDLEMELKELSNNNLKSAKFESMSILFYVMKTRYYLNKLENNEALKSIEILFDLTDNDKYITVKHNTYYLMIYYAINTNNFEKLKEVLSLLKKSILSLDHFSIEYTKSMITYSRFKGYYYLLIKNYTKATDYFKKALIITHNNIFNLDVTYQASIYYYLGQTYLLERKYKEAVDCFNHCIKLLMKDNLLVDAILSSKGFLAIAQYLCLDVKKAITIIHDYQTKQNERGFNFKESLFESCFSIILNDNKKHLTCFNNELDQEIYDIVLNKERKNKRS